MRNIKEIKAEVDALRDAYEAKVAELNAEMEMVRKARGYVRKERKYDDYYEVGRDHMPTPSGGMGASLEAGSMCDGLGKSYF